MRFSSARAGPDTLAHILMEQAGPKLEAKTKYLAVEVIAVRGSGVVRIRVRVQAKGRVKGRGLGLEKC